MSNQISLMCDVCKGCVTPAPKKLPKGWKVTASSGPTHICSVCEDSRERLEDFLAWLPEEVIRLCGGTYDIEDALFKVELDALYAQFLEQL